MKPIFKISAVLHAHRVAGRRLFYTRHQMHTGWSCWPRCWGTIDLQWKIKTWKTTNDRPLVMLEYIRVYSTPYARTITKIDQSMPLGRDLCWLIPALANLLLGPSLGFVIVMLASCLHRVFVHYQSPIFGIGDTGRWSYQPFAWSGGSVPRHQSTVKWSSPGFLWRWSARVKTARVTACLVWLRNSLGLSILVCFVWFTFSHPQIRQCFLQLFNIRLRNYRICTWALVHRNEALCNPKIYELGNMSGRKKKDRVERLASMTRIHYILSG